MKNLENSGFKYTLLASTLEDAFINLGEQDDTAEEEQRKAALIKDMFSRKFETNATHKLLALLVRKFFLLFKSMM